MVGLRRRLIGHAALSGVLAASSTVFVLTIFDWDPKDVAIWGAIGAVVWGVVDFCAWTARVLPRGDLPSPPADAVLEPRGGVSLRAVVRVMAVVAACFGLAWLATEMDAGGVSIPGQFIGYALASLAGALWVARWERLNRRTVLTRFEDEDEELYATPAAAVDR